MTQYCQRRYGEPCLVCGYSWKTPVESCALTIATMPATYSAILERSDGSNKSAHLGWNAVAYVAHMADNTRIWAERVVSAASGYRDAIPYDEDALALARNYSALKLPGALWSLQRAVLDWEEALTMAQAAPALTILHPEQGPLDLADAIRIMAHEAFHHSLDLTLSMEATSPPNAIAQVPPPALTEMTPD